MSTGLTKWRTGLGVLSGHVIPSSRAPCRRSKQFFTYDYYVLYVVVYVVLKTFPLIDHSFSFGGIITPLGVYLGLLYRIELNTQFEFKRLVINVNKQ